MIYSRKRSLVGGGADSVSHLEIDVRAPSLNFQIARSTFHSVSIVAGEGKMV